MWQSTAKKSSATCACSIRVPLHAHTSSSFGRYNGRFQIPQRGKMMMDIASIASSFASDAPEKGRYEIFNRVEFEEFMSAVKKLLDSTVSAKDLQHAYTEALNIIRSRLLSGKQLTCKMVRAPISSTSCTCVTNHHRTHSALI